MTKRVWMDDEAALDVLVRGELHTLIEGLNEGLESDEVLAEHATEGAPSVTVRGAIEAAARYLNESDPNSELPEWVVEMFRHEDEQFDEE